MTCESPFRAHQVKFVDHLMPFKASHSDLFAALAVHSWEGTEWKENFCGTNRNVVRATDLPAAAPLQSLPVLPSSPTLHSLVGTTPALPSYFSRGQENLKGSLPAKRKRQVSFPSRMDGSTAGPRLRACTKDKSKCTERRKWLIFNVFFPATSSEGEALCGPRVL